MPAWATIPKAAWPGGRRAQRGRLRRRPVPRSRGTTPARQLDGLPGGRGLNIAHEAVDRHAAGPARAPGAPCAGSPATARSPRPPTRSWRRARTGSPTSWRDLGVGQGRPRVHPARPGPRAVRDACSARSRPPRVLCPLFSAFGPEPIRQRLDRGDGRVLVTTPALYRRKVAADPRRAARPRARPAGGRRRRRHRGHARASTRVLAAASDRFEIPPTDPEDMALLHFTSGTTGTPKGAVHVHEAVVAHHATGTIGPRPARRRRVLVHRRPRVGDGHLLRHHRPAHPRRDQHRRRGRVRRRALVPHPRRTSG